MKTHNSLLVLLCCLCFVFQSCIKSKSPEPNLNFVSSFYQHTSKLEIIVGYEENAEPYTSFSASNAWDVCEGNLRNLLSARQITVEVPTELSAMTNLGILEQHNYSRQNIIDISAKIQQHTNLGFSKGITILFLDGNYIIDGEISHKVAGLNISGTSIVAIFKPVIEASSNSLVIRTLVEQSTAVHEIGHALGLVNNGVRPTSAHHDEENGAHCTNENCVMFWNNGARNVTSFVSTFLAGGEIMFFGNKCIADIEAK